MFEVPIPNCNIIVALGVYGEDQYEYIGLIELRVIVRIKLALFNQVHGGRPILNWPVGVKTELKSLDKRECILIMRSLPKFRTTHQAGNSMSFTRYCYFELVLMLIVDQIVAQPVFLSQVQEIASDASSSSQSQASLQ